MKVWELEKDYQAILSFIMRCREQNRGDIKSRVEAIRQEVKEGGEEAIKGLCRRFDRWEGDYDLKIDKKDIERAASGVSRQDLSVIKGMIRNVGLYHKNQGLKTRVYKRKGLIVEETIVPVERALVYVPGGKAAYPSSMIMGVVPARIAGVRDIYITTPTPGGVLHPYVAATAMLLGTTEIYRIGGAQAVYAFSYGIGSIPKVDMIVGPGNAYVDEAKRDVYGTVGIDMLAGPSELIVLCTDGFSPDLVAKDLFSQAEHDEMATVGLLSNSRAHIEEVIKSIDRLKATNERRDIIENALKANSFFVYFEDIDKAVDFINAVAPEHMELIGHKAIGEKILYPGIIYIGPMTPVAMGDYYIGTNHVLPTGGAGRFTGGLSVDSFKRRRVQVEIDRDFLERYGDKAVRLARIEGLFAHGESIKARKGAKI
ncbi:MAG TPA: histidinol dehydrogenase [Syntrophorhabdaceae bacterium]|nr:histidinol dehydrogenase [Syntrophorhabdaceae bacterium]HOL04897.1 histidinol dehydrogenase [Syntrophorhabdaceae bacterium]HON84441.1 histidinol dehydrogenase [Syntrophorhabdaceae bacterium]HOT41180.1 histidinol dehydrogenase [Syntrophorhabdaceae bacterium]HPC65757.1 histidinol dehydrogenase [Syntrophorhabdaceae bacterium]